MDQDVYISHHEQKQFLNCYYSEDGKNLRKMNKLESDLVFSEGGTLQECVNKDSQFSQTKVNNPQKCTSISRINLIDNSYIENTTINVKKKDVSINYLPHSDISNPPAALEPSQMNYQPDFLSPYVQKVSNCRLSFSHQPVLQIEQKSRASSCYNLSSESVEKKNDSKRVQHRQSNVSSFNYNFQFIVKLKNQLMNFYKNYTITGRSLNINNQIRRRINDKSDILQEQVRNIVMISDSFLHFTRLKYLNKIIPLLNPQSIIGFSIHLAFVIFNCLFCLVYSLIIIFPNQILNEASFGSIVFTIWCIEILLRLNTITFSLTSIIKDRGIILHLYFKQRFIFDTIPLILINVNAHVSYVQQIIQLCVFLKAKNILLDIDNMQKNICMIIKNYFVIKLFNLFAILFLIGHIIACAWYLIGLYELEVLQEEKTWFKDSVDYDGVWWKLYLSAFYWAISLMTQGSNTANTLLEIAFTSCIIPFTTIIFGYLLNVIGIILSEMDELDEKKRRDINIINEYMRIKQISKTLQRQVNIDLDYYYMQNIKQKSEDNNSVLVKISNNLKVSLLQEYNIKILQKIPLFQNHFSNSSLKELCLYMEEVYFFPNQIIFLENQLDDQYLYYIESGRVQLLQQFSQDERIEECCSVVNELYPGEYYGWMSFFTGVNKSLIAKSVDFTKLIRIKRIDFLNIIKKDEKEYQIFCSIRDNLFFYENYEEVKQTCSICSSFTHQSTTCNKVHFDKKRSYQKISFNQIGAQERLFKERRIHNFNSLYNQEIIQQAQLLYYDYNKGILTNDNHKKTLVKLETDFQSSFSDTDSYYTQKQQQQQQQQNQQTQKTDSKNHLLEVENPSQLNFQKQKSANIRDSDSFLSLGRRESYLEDLAKIPSQQLKENSQYTEGKPQKVDTKEELSLIPIGQNNEEGIYDKTRKSKRSQQNSHTHTHHTRTLMKKLSLKVPTDDLKMVKFEDKQTVLNSNSHQTPVILMKQQYPTAFEYIQYYDNPWLFESLKDYLYYFIDGNSKLQIMKYNKYLKKLQKHNKRAKNPHQKSKFSKQDK